MVLFPEAMNRFYLHGYKGRVGATWMTSEDRLTDIEDNISYLEELTKQTLDKHPTIEKVNVLGFSQEMDIE